MTDMWTKTVAGFHVWKIALVKTLMLSFVAGITMYQTAMSGGVQWGTLSATDKSLVFAGILTAIANVIVAFLDKSISHITDEQKTLADAEAGPLKLP